MIDVKTEMFNKIFDLASDVYTNKPRKQLAESVSQSRNQYVNKNKVISLEDFEELLVPTDPTAGAEDFYIGWVCVQFVQEVANMRYGTPTPVGTNVRSTIASTGKFPETGKPVNRKQLTRAVRDSGKPIELTPEERKHIEAYLDDMRRALELFNFAVVFGVIIEETADISRYNYPEFMRTVYAVEREGCTHCGGTASLQNVMRPIVGADGKPTGETVDTKLKQCSRCGTREFLTHYGYSLATIHTARQYYDKWLSDANIAFNEIYKMEDDYPYTLTQIVLYEPYAALCRKDGDRVHWCVALSPQNFDGYSINRTPYPCYLFLIRDKNFIADKEKNRPEDRRKGWWMYLVEYEIESVNEETKEITYSHKKLRDVWDWFDNQVSEDQMMNAIRSGKGQPYLGLTARN